MTKKIVIIIILVVAAGALWLLDARITTSSAQAVEFAQNSAVISYTGGSVTKTTGLFPVRTGQAKTPQIREIAP